MELCFRGDVLFVLSIVSTQKKMKFRLCLKTAFCNACCETGSAWSLWEFCAVCCGGVFISIFCVLSLKELRVWKGLRDEQFLAYNLCAQRKFEEEPGGVIRFCRISI